ncbi:MAG: hypothetical protein ACFFCS_21425 [Candidatus Hodarchaeota archaeon]
MVQAGEWDQYKVQQVKQIKPEFKALLYHNYKVVWEGATADFQTAIANNWILRDITIPITFPPYRQLRIVLRTITYHSRGKLTAKAPRAIFLHRDYITSRLKLMIIHIEAILFYY